MSAWKLCLKKLHDADRPLKPLKVSMLRDDRRMLLVYGLAELKRSGREFRYHITQRGRDVATGRLAFQAPKHKPGRLGARRWAATWMAPLPEPRP